MMRSVRVDSEVEAELEDARRIWLRVDDAWEMIEWVLARDPTSGSPVTESGAARSFVFEGAWAHNMPTIQVLYMFDDRYVTIKSARFFNPMLSGGTA